MQDLASMINQVMANPDAMKQLNDVASSLGLGTPPPNGSAAATQMPDISNLFSSESAPAASAAPLQSTSAPAPAFDLSSLLGGLGGMGAAPQSTSAPSFDPKTLILLQNAFRAFSADDQNTRLLRAMQPLLSEERGKKIDDAIKFLGLLKLLPLLKDSGLFSSK